MVNEIMNKTSGTATHCFDKECLERYGAKTCVIVQNGESYEMRLLDKLQKNNKEVYTVKKTLFYKLIPNLLLYKYTVVVVEELRNMRHLEITAVHLPVQPSLNAPPPFF